MFNSSNLTLENEKEKSPSNRESIMMVACVNGDTVRLVLTHDVRRQRMARCLPAKSLPRFFRLKPPYMQKFTMLLSKTSQCLPWSKKTILDRQDGNTGSRLEGSQFHF